MQTSVKEIFFEYREMAFEYRTKKHVKVGYRRKKTITIQWKAIQRTKLTKTSIEFPSLVG